MSNAKHAATYRAKQLSLRTAQAKRVEELSEALRYTLSWLRAAPLESGWCCCGDKVQSHGMGSGHSPVDELRYGAGQLEDRIIQALEGSAKP